MISTIVGMIFIVIGVAYFFLGYQTCLNIVDITKFDYDGLTVNESWINIQQASKAEKLTKYASQSENQQLKDNAKKALKYEKLFYLFLFLGIITIIIGEKLLGI